MHSQTDHAHDLHCDHPKIADFTDLLVRDVMVSRPKTMTAGASVADVRRVFANPHVISALLVDGTVFAGMINRGDVPSTGSDDAPARDFARTDVPTVRPDAKVADAIAVLDSNRDRRLVVLDDDGVTLAGLICLDESRDSFCQSNLTVG